jgi:hypothetical protein
MTELAKEQTCSSISKGQPNSSLSIGALILLPLSFSLLYSPAADM